MTEARTTITAHDPSEHEETQTPDMAAPATKDVAASLVPGDERCGRCAHAKQHGWWGPGSRSHCRDCHYEWNGLNEAHCATCHAHFSSSRGFDYHLTEDGCRNPETTLRQDGRPRFVETTGLAGQSMWHAPRYDDRVRPWTRTEDTAVA